ncbi:hypothetical protein LDENG_00275560 [Lucifuga dentata]|nr:hypothetical protein LDENG_00275560 [Lucifuga dentata]
MSSDLVHLTCQSVGSAYQDLSPTVTRMFQTPESHEQEDRPSVLWCLYFNMVDGLGVECENGDLGHEHAIKQAESIFQKILPEEDFCPPAPNPEDIIYDGEKGFSSSLGEEEEEEREREEVIKEEEDFEEQIFQTEE